MMPVEILAERLYDAYIASARPMTPVLSSPPRWLDLGREGRSRWREVAEEALRSCVSHGAVSPGP